MCCHRNKIIIEHAGSISKIQKLFTLIYDIYFVSKNVEVFYYFIIIVKIVEYLVPIGTITTQSKRSRYKITVFSENFEQLQCLTF